MLFRLRGLHWFVGFPASVLAGRIEGYGASSSRVDGCRHRVFNRVSMAPRLGGHHHHHHHRHRHRHHHNILLYMFFIIINSNNNNNIKKKKKKKPQTACIREKKPWYLNTFFELTCYMFQIGGDDASEGLPAEFSFREELFMGQKNRFFPLKSCCV